MLDRHNYYATTGGHGACRGCGEVTAIRLVTGTNHAIHDKRRRKQIREVEDLIEQLNAKLGSVVDTDDDPQRKRAHRRHARDAREAPLSARKRTARRRAGQRRDLQRDGLQQRLRVDLPVQPLHRPVGEQPVPGLARRRQGHVRRPRRRRGRAGARAARRQARARRRLRSAGARQVASHLELDRVHARRAGDAADRAEHRRRRRHLRHRLRRAVALLLARRRRSRSSC